MKNQLLFILYFGLSTLLTWWFVSVSPLYISEEQMLLSALVAGSKWGIQIIIAFLLLNEKKWEFVKNIGFVCFLGSCILVPYAILSSLHFADNRSFFIGSLVVSVVVMIWRYYRAVKKTGVSLNWWFYWLICLALAIGLQLTVVFHVL